MSKINWRPKGWKTWWERNPIYNETYDTMNIARGFEKGADAMVEATIKLIETIKAGNPSPTKDYRQGFDNACDRILGNLKRKAK